MCAISYSMDAYNTKIKAEDKKRQLVERKAKLRTLLDNERKQFEVCVSNGFREASSTKGFITT